jgi:hypothetical protein
VLWIQDDYPGSRFLSILDPGSPIQQQQQKRRGKNYFFLPIFEATNITKIGNYFIYEHVKKKFEPIHKELLYFLPQKMSLMSQKYEFGIRDPGSVKIYYGIPDPWVKMAPDPGSATLPVINLYF